MKIAYLVLCHEDAPHIYRLAHRLVSDASDGAVFVHVDKKSAIRSDLALLFRELPDAYIIDETYEIHWGGFSAINATYALLRAATSGRTFDRYVLLQGADYPLKSNRDIIEFFKEHKEVEYLRAVNCATSERKYFYSKARYPQQYDRRTLLTRILNRAVRILDLKLKPKEWLVDGSPWQVHWGCAHFAITHRCAELFLSYENNEALRAHFANVFPADETFFHTILYNSELASATTHGRAESDQHVHNLVDLINLTYFEYPTLVKIFTGEDYPSLARLPHLYVRKVRTKESHELLDMLDAQDQRGAMQRRIEPRADA